MITEPSQQSVAFERKIKLDRRWNLIYHYCLILPDLKHHQQQGLPMPSFDIVSIVSNHELTNAVDQSQKEISNRFDFRGTSAKIEQEKEEIWLYGDNDFQLDQIKDIFIAKCVKRGIDPSSCTFESIQSNHSNVKRKITIKQGIDGDFAKSITKDIKNQKLKVQTSFMESKIRVTGKKRDDLQTAIGFLKEQNYPQSLQFENFRD